MKKEAVSRVKRQIKRAPFPALLGLKLRTVAPGRVVIRMPNRAQFRQYRGATHGGALASLIDTAATFASNTLIGEEQDSVTIEMKVNFLAAGTGRHLEAHAKVLHHGRTTSVSTVEVLRADGVRCAYATVTNLVYRKQV